MARRARRPRRSNLAYTLEQTRLERGLDPIDVAPQIGVDRSNLWRWEQGRTIPPEDKLVALAALYEVEVGPLLKMRDQAERTRRKVRNGARRAQKFSGDGAAVLSLLITLVVL